MVRSLAKWTLAGLVLAAVAIPVSAQPITVAPGNDGWVTPANSSQVDLSVFPISAFFGPGAVVSPTIVPLSGSPLDAANLGSIDTLLERYPPSVTFTTFPETHTLSVELKALRLKGQTTIDGVTYNLVVALSETPSGAGTISATRLTADGGRFNSSFPVLPKLVFTEVGNPSNQVVIDCGSVTGCPSPLTLGASNVCWEVAHGPNNFDPNTKGITPIRAGIAVDGTYNGVNDYTTVGRLRSGFTGLEFDVGFDPTPPWNPCGNVSHNHAVYSLTHVATTPTDCKTTTTATDTTGTTKRAGKAVIIDQQQRLCPAVIAQPADPTQPVDPVGTVKKKPSGGKP